MGLDFKKLLGMRVKIYPLERGEKTFHITSRVLPSSNLSSGRIYFLAITMPEIWSHDEFYQVPKDQVYLYRCHLIMI